MAKPNFEEVNYTSATTPTNPGVERPQKQTSSKPVTEQRLPGGLDEQTKKLYKHYSEENKVQVSIAPMYAPYFGNVMVVTINGISIKVPCNGQKVNVPETFAAEIERRLSMINTKLNREHRLGGNAVFENSPGDARLF